MTKARLILVVPDDGAITREARTERRALYQAVADKIGAELLVAGFGTPQLLEVPLLTEAVPAASSAAPFRELAGGIAYSPEVIAAFRLLEPLLNAGDVKLVYDRWAQDSLRFMAPHTTQPSALMPKDLGCFTLVESADLKGKRFCPGTLLIGGVCGVVFSTVVAWAVRLASL